MEYSHNVQKETFRLNRQFFISFLFRCKWNDDNNKMRKFFVKDKIKKFYEEESKKPEKRTTRNCNIK